ncbi:segregation/condensation protein A [Clostridium sp.]|uniref:segregation/condensation protein A n=1 Tax=Clostridium sp. TaxID=1506 RepID=UPI0026DB75EF|nr:segregation/condensation protein A [Clostridium sp.]MDO5040159.1 segregation/condensation protein A [Clostridium sp.]
MELPKIRVADFEGPFDLLLYLIKKNKMNIYNVEIYKITNQYLQYLDTMKEMDLEITSEFIVIAATLIEIKSKSLLPKVKKVEEVEEDVEKKLLEKLILYKKIKASTEYFKKVSLENNISYSKKPEIIEDISDNKIDNKELFKDLTLIDLYNIYNKLLEVKKNKKNDFNIIQRNIKTDQYKIEDKYDYILKSLKKNNIRKFSEFINKCENKLECVVTFLALLELIKQKQVKIYQSSNFEDIIIKGCDGNGES